MDTGKAPPSPRFPWCKYTHHKLELLGKYVQIIVITQVTGCHRCTCDTESRVVTGSPVNVTGVTGENPPTRVRACIAYLYIFLFLFSCAISKKSPVTPVTEGSKPVVERVSLSQVHL